MPDMQNLNYSCLNCIYQGYNWDTYGCFDQTQNASRVSNATLTTQQGCFQASQFDSSNQQVIGDLSNNSYAYNVACQQQGQEIVVSLQDTLMQIDSVNASIQTLNQTDNSTIDAVMATYCSAAPGGVCGLGVIPGRGFIGYNTSYNETLSLWMLCVGPSAWNISLQVTGVF